MLETIQQSAISHDRYQIELKLDYELGKGEKTHYRISTYLFFPKSLGINEESYPKSEFYRDVKNYIRIKTPILSLRDLIESDVSPLSAVQKIVHQANWYQDDELNDRLINALKLFGAMFKSTLREHLNLVDKRIQNALTKTKVHTLVENLIQEFIEQSKQISSHYRAFYAELNLPIVKEDAFLAYTLVDEYISMLIEESATELFQTVSQHFKKSSKSKSLDDLNQIVEMERGHRQTHGYGLCLEEICQFHSPSIDRCAARGPRHGAVSDGDCSRHLDDLCHLRCFLFPKRLRKFYVSAFCGVGHWLHVQRSHQGSRSRFIRQQIAYLPVRS